MRRERLLIASVVPRALLLAAAAAAMTGSGQGVLVVVLVGLQAGLGSVFRPVQAALLPWLARTPEELTSANAAASVLQSAAMVGGPATCERHSSAMVGETEAAELADRSSDTGSHGIVPSQPGGGCEIRTREGLPPTRFPTMRTGVHQWPPPSVTCLDMTGAAGGERCRTEVNETETETRPSARACCRVARFPGLRRAIRNRPRVSRASAETWLAAAGGQLRTEVNETRTEPGGRAADGRMGCLPGGAR
jgi:hypothetical protein